MPRGGRRVGTGRKPKPLADHVQAGTFRADRHGPLPVGNVLAMPRPVLPCWRPSSEEVAALGVAGQALVERVWGAYDPTLVDGLQVLEAARAADVLAHLRATEPLDLRQVRLWSAYYTATIRMLGLT